jgi:rubrerythrin
MNLFDEYPQEAEMNFFYLACEACGWDEGLIRTDDGDSCPDCGHTVNKPKTFSIL